MKRQSKWFFSTFTTVFLVGCAVYTPEQDTDFVGRASALAVSATGATLIDPSACDADGIQNFNVNGNITTVQTQTNGNTKSTTTITAGKKQGCSGKGSVAKEKQK